MGEACHFAHGEEDLRKVTDVSFINRSLFRSIFMNFTNPRKLSQQLNQPIKQFSAKTSQSLVNVNLEIDAHLPMELKSIRWNQVMFLTMLKEPFSIRNTDTNSTRPRPIFLSLLQLGQDGIILISANCKSFHTLVVLDRLALTTKTPKPQNPI